MVHRLLLLPVLTILAFPVCGLTQESKTNDERSVLLAPLALKVCSDMEKSIVKIQRQAITDLEKVKRDFTKRGDLKNANAVEGKIKELQDEIEIRLSGERYYPPDPVVGNWIAGDVQFTFSRNGTWTSNCANFGGIWRRNNAVVEVVSNLENQQTFTVVSEEGRRWTWNRGTTGGVVAKVQKKK